MDTKPKVHKPGRRKVCCICGIKVFDKKKTSAFRKSSSYEADFECCFGAAAEGRSGDICPNCRKIVAILYRNNRDLSYEHVLNLNSDDVVKKEEQKPSPPDHESLDITSTSRTTTRVPLSPVSPNKRPRDESPLPIRIQRQRMPNETTDFLLRVMMTYWSPRVQTHRHHHPSSDFIIRIG